MNSVAADPNEGTGETAAGTIPLEDASDAEGTPYFTLGDFSGPLHHLLTLARSQKIDLAAIPLAALADQLAVALSRAAATPLGRKGDWVVMTAWLVQLRSLLLLPPDAPGREDAAAEADRLRTRLAGLQEMQGLAGWLERRPQLGCDVFARGRPEAFGVSVDAGPAIDVVEFLWAGMAQFEDAAAAATDTVYQPRLFPELYAVAEALDRIRCRLAATPGGATLDRLLPEPDSSEDEERRVLRRRSARTSTFSACLELAKQGEAALRQEMGFQPIQVSPA